MASQANVALPAGARLESYRIVRTLASGGFSFVYLAHDEREAKVLIKEYLPAALALRIEPDAAPRVAPVDENRFRHGMKCFFDEGRALARLRHPNVVHVLNFFRANGTVYLVMRYERGRSLEHHIRHRSGLPDEVWVRATFAQLLNGLRAVHEAQLLHLDIKPANVYIRDDGSPLLIDFGAARQVLAGEMPLSELAYTPGYAAPEQHARRDALGPWTDLYSVGATLYACFAGTAPLRAEERLREDGLPSARQAWAGQYSGALLEIVDWCLRLEARERPQSVVELQQALLGEREPSAAKAAFK